MTTKKPFFFAFSVISFTLKHFPIIPCIFQKKNISLHKKRRIIKTRRLSMDLFDSKRQERLEAARKASVASKEAARKFLIEAGILLPNGEVAPHLR
ncbi:hypothetical protein F7D20_11265 [Prevotella copri]|uniref:Uncharacterized protein n=1 Tax=Segatella copri TaxID=165179 RepID=A0A6A7WDG4_9BACT|nr:hypothetical protein [Segatella copri]MQP12519.1 hypothetical protein [Segatella copri]